MFSKLFCRSLFFISVLALAACGGGGGGGGTTPTYTVGVTVSGLTGSGLVLQNNGGDDLSISADGGFSFATQLADGAGYSVTVLTQPSLPAQFCVLANESGTGTISSGDVTDVEVLCSDYWIWQSGSGTIQQSGVYGTKGVADIGNAPGGRHQAVSWVDNSDTLWLFGGLGFDSLGSRNILNDLWKFDGTQWIWVSGADVINQQGVYGTKGTAASSNMPGSRSGAISWVDSNNILWLFGGDGYGSTVSRNVLNDLWKFDGTQWTWVSGANVPSQTGVYGTQGVAAASNMPGSRVNAISWVDSNDILWLFGGNGLDSAGTKGHLNDLWKFDGTQWTWVSGSNIVNQAGVYGTQGSAAASNMPGSRFSAVSWVDSNDVLWLFGGEGYDSNGSPGILNDLWMFDGTQWTWVSGSNIFNRTGVYGTQGTSAANNMPGSRTLFTSWIDSNDILWLYGGIGLGSTVGAGPLNDLWKFDGTQWTWLSGSDVVNQLGVYGMQGTASTSNMPSARYGQVSWVDSNDTLWLFGGNGYDSSGNYTGTNSSLNDLWRYTP